MIKLSECSALRVKDEDVSLDAVLRIAKLKDQLQFIEDAIEATLIRQNAASRGIGVSDEELQQAADTFRVARDLHDVEATKTWLEARSLSYEDWELLLEDQIITHKLREALVASRVEQHFAEQRLSFDTATISRLVSKEELLAGVSMAAASTRAISSTWMRLKTWPGLTTRLAVPAFRLSMTLRTFTRWRGNTRLTPAD